MLVNGVYGDLLSDHASFFIALVAIGIGYTAFPCRLYWRPYQSQ